MAILLQTKLNPPASSGGLVPRPRARWILDQGVGGALTLVSAPAGYGKTTLVSGWLEAQERPSAWLSLDAADADLDRFLRYFVAAVRTAFPDACPHTLELLEAPDRPPASILATTLANDLEAVETPFILVLDDYQNIDNAEVHDLLSKLAIHPPRPLHLALVTRRDPPLPLARLRAHGSLTEVRLEHLRFTSPEVASLLEQEAGFAASDEVLDNLEREFEGWVVGLRMACLALPAQEDPDAFLSTLHAGLQPVRDFLLTEVLARRPPVVRDWLLKTSMLDRFCAPLCEAVCRPDPDSVGAELDGREFIELLRREGLFIIGLDANGEWYRYHHTFRRLLRQRHESESDTDSISALHSRASQWFEAQNLISEAIDYALSGGDATRAAEIVERNRFAALDSNRWYDLESWLNRLPDEIRGQRLGLLMTEAWSANYKGQNAKIAGILERAEAFDADGMESAERIFFRGMLALWSGDAARSAACFGEVLSLVPEADSWIRGHSEANRSLALHISGRSEDAIQSLEAAVDRNALTRGLVWSRVVGVLVFVRLLRGELPQARQEAMRLREGARRAAGDFLDAWTDYLLGNAALRVFDLATARRHLEGAASRYHALHRSFALDALTGAAIACQMMGHPEEADAHVARARQIAQWNPIPEHPEIVRSCEARIALLRGNLDAAALWLQSVRKSPDPSQVIFQMEVRSITECRVLTATGDEVGLREATEKLEQLWSSFGALHNTCQQLEIAPLQALALHRQGRTDEALKVLEQSLALAAPGGWVRPYVELGAPLADLLARLPAETAFVRRIQAAFGASAPSAPTGTPQLPEALTNREQDVLELLAQRLRDKEIAEKLFISPGTVKSHLKGLYQKLGVGGRREAVATARDLGLVTGP